LSEFSSPPVGFEGDDILSGAGSSGDGLFDISDGVRGCTGGCFAVKCESLRGTPTLPERYMIGTRDRVRLPQLNVIVQVIFYVDMKGGQPDRPRASAFFNESVDGGVNPCKSHTLRTLIQHGTPMR